MHYCAEIFISKMKEIDDAWIFPKVLLEKILKEIMDPEIEKFHENEEMTGFFDWYQIGGRYKGNHVADYDSSMDANNFEICDYCERYKRKDCNHCKGRGMRIAWPTQWEPHPKDIIKVEEIKNKDLTTWTFWDGKKFHHKEEWLDGTFVKNSFDGSFPAMKELIGDKEGYLLTVDYHS